MENNKNSQLIPIFNDIHAIDYNLKDKLPAQLHQGSAQGTLNAWIEGSLVDGIGQVWIRIDLLPKIWRTDFSTVSFLVGRIRTYDKETFNGYKYVKYSAVIYRLNEIIQSPIPHKRREYLRVSESIGQSVRDSTAVEVIRLRYYEFINETKKKLKKQRIKSYKIEHDELTGLLLDINSSEFHHIRRQSIAPSLISFIWNGLVINKETHKMITTKGISDEYDLKQLCLEMNWSLAWFEIYENDVATLRHR